MLSATDIQGLYAIIPTPARAGAEHWSATETVDLPETARLVNKLIADGVSGLIILGTTGECATLSRPDYETFVTCVLDTVARRVPTFVGATALGTHEVVSRLRFAKSLGADGTLLGLPMWQPLTLDMAVRYYASISAAFPDLAIMVYANTRAFRFDYTTIFWETVAKAAPTVVTAKCSQAKDLPDMIRRTANAIHFLPSDMVVSDFRKASPGTTKACWATAAAMGPAPALALIDAIQRGDMTLIERYAQDIAWANEPIMEIIKDPQVFASYNIQIEKIRMREAGYCAPGPVRPPYDSIPDQYAALASECGRRWATLCHRLQSPETAGRHGAAQPT